MRVFLPFEMKPDYEAIIMDKILDLELLPTESLLQPSARSFFSQQRIFSLLHQGFQQSKTQPYHTKSHWFSKFTDSWYFSYCATKHRLIDILQQYTPEWESSFAKNNVVETSSLDETYELLRESHNSIMSASARANSSLSNFINNNPHLSHYMRFVSASIEYNEELRLLRSRSVVSMIHRAIDNGLEPYQVFLDVIADRKIRLQREFGKGL